MKKQDFIKQYLPLDQKAGVQFGMNPVIILAQSAIETGWGESTPVSYTHLTLPTILLV